MAPCSWDALPEVPSLLQPGDREDVLARILESKSHLDTLLVAPEGGCPTPAERLTRYRTLAGQVHPDRCVDPRAGAAFRRVSEAFDALGALDGPPGPSEDPAGARDEGRWWLAGGVRELEALLDFRAQVAEACATLALSLDGDRLRRLQAFVSNAERSCEHLDRLRGFRRRRLWPAGRAAPAAAEASCGLQARQQTSRLLDLLSHLRAVHCFCALVGRGFDHPAELDAGSPLAAAGGLVERLLAGTSSAAQLESPECLAMAPTTEGDRDPLDDYMAAVEAQLGGCPDAKRPRAASGPARSGPGAARPTPAGPALEPASAPGAAAAAPPQGAPANWRPHPGRLGPAPQPPPMAPAAGQPGPLPPLVRPGKRAPPAPGEGIRLATGSVVNLPATTTAAPGHDRSGTRLAPDGGLQDRLLGDLDSDGSELEGG